MNEHSSLVYKSLPCTHKDNECPICRERLSATKKISVIYKMKKAEQIKQLQLPYCQFCGLVFVSSAFNNHDADGFSVYIRKVSSFIIDTDAEADRVRKDCQVTKETKASKPSVLNGDRIRCCRCRILYDRSLIDYYDDHPYCPLCLFKYHTPAYDIDFLPGHSNIKPIITVNSVNPVRCRYYDHVVNDVSVKALFLCEGKQKPHVIDMSYCPQCNRLYIFRNVLQEYEERYGMFLIEKQYTDSSFHFNQASREYASDTILSRWGYCAQADKQSENERRAILTAMMQYNPSYKEEIKSILNCFIRVCF